MRHALAEGIKQMVDKFQSQTRSRSTCDFTITRAPSRTAWVQSQTRSRSTCDRLEARFHTVLTHRFNLRREAAPHATQKYATAPKESGQFQSQTRSRSTCDFSSGAAREDRKAFQSQTRSRSTCDYNIMGNDVQVVSFNLRREAAPHATSSNTLASESLISVSISDEKPLHMRRIAAMCLIVTCISFNLRREAAPHATWRATVGSKGGCYVSISDEKPLHMRQDLFLPKKCHCCGFNLRREAAPHATQDDVDVETTKWSVSISDEKPLHMRLATNERGRSGWGWVSISDEKPLHMRHGAYRLSLASIKCFNLRREAAPHATP